jgi:hypothetical protein
VAEEDSRVQKMKEEAQVVCHQEEENQEVEDFSQEAKVEVEKLDVTHVER